MMEVLVQMGCQSVATGTYLASMACHSYSAEISDYIMKVQLLITGNQLSLHIKAVEGQAIVDGLDVNDRYV